jgi:hypothetical protein
LDDKRECQRIADMDGRMNETDERDEGRQHGRAAAVQKFGDLYDLSSSELGESDEGRLLAALETLREIRGYLDRWEPALITAARSRGLTWAQIAPALGLASRQAAERRYLRLKPHAVDSPGSTRERRVEATRNQRSAARAVAEWARAHAADLRQLAGQLTALSAGSTAAEASSSLSAGARAGLDRLRAALAGNDAADLVDPLTNLDGTVRAELQARHPRLADKVIALQRAAGQIRDDDLARRNTSGGSAADR